MGHPSKIDEMETVFFKNTYRDYHANGSNRAYWVKLFRKITGEKSKINLYSSFDEDVPIYEFYSEAKGRCVRIMQYNPDNDIIREEKYSANRFFTAWIDQRVLQVEDNLTVPELVVCLLMTKTNVSMAEALLRCWLMGDDNLTKELIQGIYRNQEEMGFEVRR